MNSLDNLIKAEDVVSMFPFRDPMAHKGDFGHLLLVAGRTGMMGAASLAAGGALKSGCGLVTVHVPSSERFIIQVSHPSAIVSLDPASSFSVLPDDMSKYSAVGAGPGLGRDPETVSALGRLLRSGKPAVLDADALNIIASHPGYFPIIPPGSVLTPHIGELKRLLRSALSCGLIASAGAGTDEVWADEEERMELVKRLAAATGAVVIVKGHHTAVCSPDCTLRYNTTGNPGMAKGGSGDILTGLIAGLLARNFSAENAAAAGVYIHGRAGDKAAWLFGEESMNASDILRCLKI